MIQQKFKNFISILFNKKSIIYYCSFLIPFLTFFVYFLCNKSNILTVDLGQQYVDFFAFLKTNLKNPLTLIYSFQNGLGGSMLGTISYYLLSPLNLILLLFNQDHLPFAILLIIAIKIGLCGISSFIYWKDKNNPLASLAASFAYALSGYIIANHFNLMWLDSAILLPFLIMAINKVLAEKKDHLILVTFLLWFTNFYTGFMTLFFGLLYFLSKIYFYPNKKSIIFQYLKKSITGSFLASFVLLPTFFEMLSGKASTSVDFDFGFQFPPYEQLLKLMDGAYSFQEMESGLPNIFITMPFLTLLICYFLSEKINWKNKLANGILLLFMTMSLFWTPLVLLWHMGQFPVWYPGRFSFIWIFLALNLGMTFLRQNTSPATWQKIAISVLSLILIVYWVLSDDKTSYITNTTLIISSLFLVLALLFITFVYNKHKYSNQVLVGIVTLEVIVNLVLSLNNLSYQKNSDYTNFAQNSTRVTNFLKKKDDTLFRTEKTFYRSDDDPFTANYNGISNFNSISNQRVLTLLANLGYLHNSNSYTNYGGTPLTDDLLGIKYYIEPNYAADETSKNKKMVFNNSNHRLDLDDYQLIHEFKQLLLVKNNTALPLVFTTKAKATKVNFNPNTPIRNQQLLFQEMTNSSQKFFEQVDLPTAKLTNLAKRPNNTMEFSKKKQSLNGKISFNLKLKTNNSYYLELPDNVTDQDVSLFVNGAEVNIETRDSQNRLINLANNQKGQNLHIVFNLKNVSLDLSNMSLWQVQTKKLDNFMQKFIHNQPKFIQTTPISLSGNIKLKSNQTLATTIPFSKNWLIFDNGHLIKTNLFANTFLSTHLTKGTHKITLIYVPFAFIFGLILTLITAIILRKKKV